VKKPYGKLRNALGNPSAFESMIAGNRVRLLRDGAEAFPAMLKAIEEAHSEILLEMYWFASDRTGTRFAQALEAKARAGVLVRVIYDAVGSLQTDERMFTRLKDAGCSVRQYNPIAPWRAQFRVGLINHRDHRKLLVVDRRIGFTGGVNLTDAWAPEEQGGQAWRDDTVRIEGPAVEQMREIFMHGWTHWHSPGSSLRPEGSLLPPPRDPDSDASGRVRVLANHYLIERLVIRRAYLQEIEAAKRSICITNSYFVPDGRIRRALASAVERGVEVRVIVQGRTDVPVAKYAGRKIFGRLLQDGIQLYEWQGPILHAKTAAIDSRWCTVGTYNLDYRSWRFNLEVTAAIEDPAMARALEQQFRADLERCEPIDYETWRDRAIQERLLDNFFFRFRKLL
jgi:cardiolipin synthase